MATSKKVTDLTALTTAVANDILYIVDDPTGTPISKKISVIDLFQSNVTSNLAFTGTLSIGANVTANVTTISVGNSSVNSVMSGGTLDVTNYVYANTFIAEYSGTPANTSDVPSGFTQGAMWADSNTFYVCVSNTEVMKVDLSTI